MAKPGPNMSAEVKLYTHEDEQLVKTDVDRLEEAKEQSQGGPAASQENTTAVQSETPQKVAVIISMQLGSSQYATMALRELMKAGGVKTYKPDFGVGR